MGYWKINDYKLQSTAAISLQNGVAAQVADLAWKIAGIRDLDNDGITDLQWRHSRLEAWNVPDAQGNRISMNLALLTDGAWLLAANGQVKGLQSGMTPQYTSNMNPATRYMATWEYRLSEFTHNIIYNGILNLHNSYHRMTLLDVTKDGRPEFIRCQAANGRSYSGAHGIPKDNQYPSMQFRNYDKDDLSGWFLNFTHPDPNVEVI